MDIEPEQTPMAEKPERDHSATVAIWIALIGFMLAAVLLYWFNMDLSEAASGPFKSDLPQ